MPARITPLVDNEIYHIVNRGTGAIPIFKNRYDYQRFIEVFLYYQNAKPPFRFSKFLDFSQLERNKIFEELKKKKDFLVEIIAYCLMPK